MTNLSKTDNEIGTTVISVNELLAKESIITAKTNEIVAKESEIATLLEKIRNLELQQKVVIKEKGRYGSEDIIEFRNLSDVERTIKEEAEKQVKKELEELRKKVVSLESTCESLNLAIERDRTSFENKRTDDRIRHAMKIEELIYNRENEIKNVQKTCNDAINKKDEKLQKVLEHNKELSNQLNEKEGTDVKQNIIKELTSSLENLRDQYNDLVSNNKIRRFVKNVLFWRKSDKYMDFLRTSYDRIYSSLFENTKSRVPSYFNEYATLTPISASNDYWSNIVTVKFKKY